MSRGGKREGGGRPAKAPEDKATQKTIKLNTELVDKAVAVTGINRPTTAVRRLLELAIEQGIWKDETRQVKPRRASKIDLFDETEPYDLESPNTVNNLLRRLLNSVVYLHTNSTTGGEDDFMPAVSGLCKKYQDIFYGRNDQYKKTTFFTKDELGRILTQDDEVGGSAEDAVYRLMLKMVGHFFSNAHFYFENGLINDDEYIDRINEITYRYAEKLTGTKKDYV